VEEVRKIDRTAAELLHADEYTPEELSELTGIGLDVVRRAVHDGNLPARKIEHDIISIRRLDALNWMESREGA
jgi:excisionase family DNA binding protein